MKKVGIIGGGLAGLTCAYKLAQKNIKSVIFEEETNTGGRMFYNQGTISEKDVYKRSHGLIKELGLDILLNEVPVTDIAFLIGDNVAGGEQAGDMIKSFSKEEGEYFQKLSQLVMSLNFDVDNPDPRLEPLKKISFKEYIKDCPPKILYSIISPLQNSSFEPDYDKIAADYGLYVLRHGFEMTNSRSFIFEENLRPLVDILWKKVKENSLTEILTSASVKKVEKKENGFAVCFTQKNEEKIEEVDEIVFAIPLPLVKNIFPEVKIESDIKYKPIKCIFVKGDLKHKRKIMTGVRESDKSNIEYFITSLPYEHLCIPFDLEKEVIFDTVYKDNKHEILREKIIEFGWPVHGPNAKIPGLKTNINGTYLCGDFYHYCFLEGSIASAEIVADFIASEEN